MSQTMDIAPIARPAASLAGVAAIESRFLTAQNKISTAATKRSWPASTPRLKVSRASSTSDCGNPVSLSAPANPKP